MRASIRTTLCLLLLAVIMHLSHSADAAAPQPIDHPFQITQDKLFAPVRPTLDALIAHKARTRINHLCVIGQPLGDGSRQAWVYWRESRAIILWEPATDGLRDLALSRRYLRLDRDAVPASDKRLATSTYLVSRSWAQSLIAECAARGTRFVIEKKQKP
jgi:hypothetical protein